MQIKIIPNDKGSPTDKLADAELHFDAGPLAGLKLIGFAVWARRTGTGRNVTFPSRQYNLNGERRSFALLRPSPDVHNDAAQNALRDLILAAYAQATEPDYPTQTSPARAVAEANAIAQAPIDYATRTSPADVAARLYATLTGNEKYGISFGLFPAGPMQAAERELAGVPNGSHALTVALMDCHRTALTQISTTPEPTPARLRDLF